MIYFMCKTLIKFKQPCLSWSVATSILFNPPENPRRREPHIRQNSQVVQNRASISVFLEQIDGSPDVIRFRGVSYSGANADGDLSPRRMALQRLEKVEGRSGAIWHPGVDATMGARGRSAETTLVEVVVVVVAVVVDVSGRSLIQWKWRRSNWKRHN